jgi:2',3'-cyclic-nucleotide 2'-phosphodiesterase (5'-nucleotidase family)
MPVITILHTNDLHNHLSQEQAEVLKLMRMAPGFEGVLVDCGDAISAGNVGIHPGGEAILERMSDAGYDAMCLGNREFHFTRYGFFTKLNRARFPVLCANIRSKDEIESLPTKSHILLKMQNGVRLMFFGLTVPMITEKMLVRKVSSFVFDNPIETAKHIVPMLRKECDLLVCMSHIGLSRDRILAEEVNGIDVILGGHSHDVILRGERVNKTLIAQTGSWGRFVGRVTLQIEQGDISSSSELISLR